MAVGVTQCLLLCLCASRTVQSVAGFLAEHVLPRAFKLASSPLLQADALASLQTLFKTLLQLGAKGLDYSFLLDSVLSSSQSDASDSKMGESSFSKQSASNVARVASVLIANGPAASRSKSITALLAQLHSTSAKVRVLGFVVPASLCPNASGGVDVDVDVDVDVEDVDVDVSVDVDVTRCSPGTASRAVLRRRDRLAGRHPVGTPRGVGRSRGHVRAPV